MARSQVIGVTFFQPHLHRIERREFGIIFEAHDAIEEHRAISQTLSELGDKQSVGEPSMEESWADMYEQLRKVNMRFALGLDAVERYSKRHNLHDYARHQIQKFMSKYSEYYHDQTEEWWTNPAMRMIGLGSSISGPDHAQYLIDKGKPELRAQLASWLHCTAAEVGEELNAESYGGPLIILTDESLWDQLKLFAEQELPLKDCKAASGLHAHIQQHFSAMFMHNAWMEELVKHWKHLSGQARAHPDTAEEHMPLHMSMHMPIRMSADMPLHMSIPMSVHMSIRTCMRMSIHMPIHRSIFFYGGVSAGAPVLAQPSRP